MLLIGLGEIAALITAVSWAASAQIHTTASRMIGPLNVPVVRIPLYMTAISLVGLVTGWSTHLPEGAFFFIAVSGVMGISLADPLLYGGSVIIGPRLAVLIQSLSTCITALAGYVFLGENLNFMGWAGIFTASFGVSFVLMEGGVRHRTDFSSLTPMQWAKGAGMVLLSATSMSIGFLLLKRGMRYDVDPIWATFIRISFGGGMLWLMMLVRGKLFRVMRETWASWRIMRILLVGTCVSTVGNCLATVAMANTQAGIAATLIGLQPIMIMIVNSLVERKRPTARAVIGTAIAFGGTAMIFLR